MVQQQRKKKAIEYHFVDMNDPDRYKKLKVARACDFCRRRKSKCDVGIPNSGTCSNCKKANHTCIFSPVTPPTITKINKRQHTIKSNSPSRMNFTDLYQDKYPFFSMNEKASCGYERDNIYAHVTLNSTPNINHQELPMYSKQTEQELMDIYFTHVHPFFPVLDKYFTLEYSHTLSNPLKWSIIAIVISRFSHQHQDSLKLSNLYHQNAIDQLQDTSSLATVQTLFLLYKYQEITTPVGHPMSTTTISYLARIQIILSELSATTATEETSTENEFICRANWILFIILSTSNNSDTRIKNLLLNCNTPNRLPLLTETEHYDKVELNTTCNLIHLINIALLYSQTMTLISDKATLFTNTKDEEFNELENGLKVWTSTLPSHINLHVSNSILQQGQDKNASSFTNYLCFIHDIIKILVSLHQHKKEVIIKNALSVCVRAHNMTIGDLQAPTFTRLASINGSRLVSFGLTLALQSFAFQQTKNDQFYTCCSLSLQIFEQITLSPQLYMIIQSFRNQIESKKKLQESNFLNTSSGLDSSSTSSNSSYSQSTPASSATSMDSSSSYYFSSKPSSSFTPTTNTSFTSPNHHQQFNNQYYSNQQQYNKNMKDGMPITPTIDPEIDISSPFIAMDSYFQPQHNTIGSSVMVSTLPFEFSQSIIENLYEAKNDLYRYSTTSCRYRRK